MSITTNVAASASTQAPNIVFILADDLGWADLSVYGQADFTTPHLDALAGEGVRFTQAYANTAVCSATRFALITGRYQYRLRGGLEEPLVRKAHVHGLPPEHPTLPSLLRDAGYDTALIGKWHLGSLPTFGPLKSGYDRFFGNYGGAIDYFTHKPGVGDAVARDLYEGEVPVERVGYYTQLLADEATRWIGERSAAQPFFLSLHFTAPHWPWVGPEDEEISLGLKDLFHYDGGNLATYARMVRSLDKAVGQVLAPSDAKTLATSAQQGDQSGLGCLQLLDDGQGTDVVEAFFWRSGLAHFLALGECNHAEGGACSVALAHHVQVAHLKHPQS